MTILLTPGRTGELLYQLLNWCWRYRGGIQFTAVLRLRESMEQSATITDRNRASERYRTSATPRVRCCRERREQTRLRCHPVSPDVPSLLGRSCTSRPHSRATRRYRENQELSAGHQTATTNRACEIVDERLLRR